MSQGRGPCTGESLCKEVLHLFHLLIQIKLQAFCLLCSGEDRHEVSAYHNTWLHNLSLRRQLIL